MDFRTALEQSMESAGLTKAALARAVGVTRQAVDDWLAKAPGPDRVFQIEAALGVEPGTLSRTLGYIPVGAAEPGTPEEAIAADERLSPYDRKVMLDLYRTLLNR